MNKTMMAIWISFLTFLLIAGFKEVEISNMKVEASSTMQEQMVEQRDYTAMYEAQAWLKERGISVPDDIRSECEMAGAEYGVCPELLEAIAWKESRFHKDAKNGSCIGVMQINSSVHSKRLEVYGIDQYSLRAQCRVAASILADLAKEYAEEGEEADAGCILMAYHGENNPSEKNLSSYADTILTLSEKLERAHGK